MISSIEGACAKPAEDTINVQAIRFIFLNTKIQPWKNAESGYDFGKVKAGAG